MSTAYVPDVGHIVWIHFDPQTGREQAGHRPALVVSPASYNAKTSLAILCPITSRVKGYPFEVAIEGDPRIVGAVLSDQVKCLDWRARKAEYKGVAGASVLAAVKRNIAVLLSL